MFFQWGTKVGVFGRTAYSYVAVHEVEPLVMMIRDHDGD